MKYILLRSIISSNMITLVSETSKKGSFIGVLTVSIPLISVLSSIWPYIDSKDIEKKRISPLVSFGCLYHP